LFFPFTEKETGLRKHLATTKHSDDLYHCPYCGLGHSQFVKLHEHFKGHDAPKKIYPCFQCKKVYLVKRYYTDHECVPATKKTEQNLEKTFASKCKRCFQEFFNEEEFACHQYLQCEDDNNQCSMCDRSFDTLQQLARHKRNHTYVQKSSVCDICGHTSVNESQMKNHKITHSDERPFKCLLCPAVFKLDYSLQSHQKMHREKQYECDLCYKKFRDYHSIRLHMALHSDNTELRKYTCELCGRALVSTTALKRHIQTHTSKQIDL
jgi:KRAB domain-containing zinc finger protein